MKSSLEALEKRGYANREQRESLAGRTKEELYAFLHGTVPLMRTTAAYHLSPLDEEDVVHLLQQLTKEKCLYTRLAIGEILEQGNKMTASHMVRYLGKIGNNQYKELPKKVSAKKSYPLPRDLIARSLGRMNPCVLPVLLGVLETQDASQISEVLDAIGFMIFYYPEEAVQEKAQVILQVAEAYREHDEVVWKCLMCLSAFPLEEAKAFFMNYISYPGLLGEEARRSLHLIEGKG